MMKRLIAAAISIMTLELVSYRAPLQAQTKTLVSAPSKSLTQFPAHLTREKGFYHAEGLDVDFVIMKPQGALQALIAGDVGYTTALGSTIRSAIRGLPLRVVMTITDKPLFALIVRPGINSVEELRGKLIGISSFGDTLARAANSTRTETLRSSPSAAAPTASRYGGKQLVGQRRSQPATHSDCDGGNSDRAETRWATRSG